MKSARHTLLEMLDENGGKMNLKEIEKRMRAAKCVGNGVEPIDVVHAAGRDGQLIYDPKTQTATLIY
ncbi:MAG: hypothetical protein Q7R73_00980 [bacterium]|nr:hypothetical protein [bacterium]